LVVAVLFSAGDHVPEMPFCEITGNSGIAASAQKGPTLAKLGLIKGFTSIVKVLDDAQVCPLGVNVYVVLAKLFMAGDQVPLIPF